MARRTGLDREREHRRRLLLEAPVRRRYLAARAEIAARARRLRHERMYGTPLGPSQFGWEPWLIPERDAVAPTVQPPAIDHHATLLSLLDNPTDRIGETA